MKKIEYNPDFFIIPYILYEDKEIKETDRNTYAGIYYFSKMRGDKCTASNTAIAKIVKSTSGTIANSIAKLIARGYVKGVYKNETKHKRLELIPLIGFGLTTQQNEGVGSLCGDMGGSLTGEQISIKGMRSSKSEILIDKSNSEKSVKLEQEEKGRIGEKYGASAIKRLLFVYSKLWKDVFGTNYKLSNWGRFGSSINRLLKHYNEYQIASLMCAMFNWYGIDGKDEKEYQFLVKAGFPIGMLELNMNKYEAYLQNVEKLDFKSVDVVRWYVLSFIG